jgi:hypothetical protein
LGRAARQRAFILAFLPVNVSMDPIAVNQMGPYNSNSSDEFPSQSTIPEPLPFNVSHLGLAHKRQDNTRRPVGQEAQRLGLDEAGGCEKDQLDN